MRSILTLALPLAVYGAMGQTHSVGRHNRKSSEPLRWLRKVFRRARGQLKGVRHRPPSRAEGGSLSEVEEFAGDRSSELVEYPYEDFEDEHPSSVAEIEFDKEEDVEKHLTESCSLSYLSPSNNGSVAGIVASANVWALDTVPRSSKCELDYLYSWNNEIPGFTRMNVIFNIHDIIHYTQTLESDVECRERLRLWSYAGLFRTRQGRNQRQSGLMDHMARVWGDAISAREHVPADVADILENARVNNIAYAPLEKVPIFIREYVLDKALLADTCVAATISIKNEVVTVTLRVASSGKLELHEIETIGSRSWSIDDFSKATADLLYEIQKRARQITDANQTRLCESQLYEYAKVIEERDREEGRMWTPKLKGTLSVDDKDKRGQQLALARFIFSTTLPWLKGTSV